MAQLLSGTRIYGNTTIDTFVVAGNVTATPATSNSTGTLIVKGGVGVTGNIHADAIYDGGVEVIQFANSAFNKANNALANTTGTFAGELSITQKLIMLATGGDEGGELLLGKPSTNTTLDGIGITIDAYQNKIRFFEQGGTARGAYIDLTECSSGALTNILNPAAVPDSVARNTANSAYIHANAAFTSSNTKFNTSGGTISGDVNITGNLTITGNTTYTNTISVLIGDNIIVLNADLPQASAPTENAGIEVERGSSANVLLIWNETTDSWTFTNDGTNYSNIASAAAETYANAAYGAANTATTTAATADQRAVTSGSYANSAYTQANTATTNAATADQRAVTSGTYANAAYVQSNTATTNAATADQRAVTSGSYANSAYEHANAAYVLANTISGGSTDTWARSAANSASSYANGAFAKANTALANTTGTFAGDLTITGNLVSNTITTAGAFGDISGANAVFANTFIANTNYRFPDGTTQTSAASPATFSQAGFNTANAASSYANSAFGVANTAATNALSAGVYANAAFLATNTAIAVNTQQNTNITIAGNYANSAYIHANAAFAAANAGGGGGSNTSVLRTGDTMSGELILTGNTANGNTALTIRSNTNFVSPNGNNVIRVRMLDSDTLSFQANSGELFSISDSLSNGSIFSVNDISGLPIIDVDANGWISLAQFGGNVRVYNASVSSSNTTGAFVVDGGVGIRGNVHTGNVIITGSGNGITFADGTRMTTAATGGGGGGTGNANTTGWLANTIIFANSAGALSNSANLQFIAANNSLIVSANIFANAIYDSGVEILAFANSAYNHANAAFGVANTGGSAVDSFARSTANAAFIKANTSLSFTYSNTAPGSPTPGSIWVDSESGIQYIYLDDGDSSQFVELTSSVSQNNYIVRADTITSNANLVTTSNYVDQLSVTALAVSANVLPPIGTPADGQKFTIRIKDNGTTRNLTWNVSTGGYRTMGIALPSATTAGKVTYVGCIYNSQDNFWDVVAAITQT